MRTVQEIEDKIKEISSVLDGNIRQSVREEIDAILDVLENIMDYDEIEDRYYDGNATYREQYANNAREWLEEELTDEEFKENCY